MSHIWKKATASFLVLALVAALCLGCAGTSEERVIIRIGQITDLTGVSSPAVLPLNYAVEDVARYYNEEGLIPGAEIKIVTYNEMTDYSREIPGYEWVRERGAKVVITVLPTTAEILKPFAERDEVPLAALGGSMSIIEPPGWVFWFNTPPSYEIKTLLKRINEEHWDYSQGTPRIGMAAWAAPYQTDLKKATEEYCQAHPDQFEWVGGHLTPIGAMTWSGEVEALKGCDYVLTPTTGIATATFVKEFQARGHTTTFISGSAVGSFRGIVVDMCGWKALDGTLTTGTCPWWNEPTPIVNMVKELLHKYRPGQAEDMIHAGLGYLGGSHNVYAVFEILREAIEEVGAEDFDGQAFYDTAMKFRTAGPMWEGCPEWAFSESKRYLVDHVKIYEWSADEGDLVMFTDWLPVTK